MWLEKTKVSCHVKRKQRWNNVWFGGQQVGFSGLFTSNFTISVVKMKGRLLNLNCAQVTCGFSQMNYKASSFFCDRWKIGVKFWKPCEYVDCWRHKNIRWTKRARSVQLLVLTYLVALRSGGGSRAPFCERGGASSSFWNYQAFFTYALENFRTLFNFWGREERIKKKRRKKWFWIKKVKMVPTQSPTLPPVAKISLTENNLFQNTSTNFEELWDGSNLR